MKMGNSQDTLAWRENIALVSQHNHTATIIQYTICRNTLDPLLRRLSLDFIDEDDLSVRIAGLFKVLFQVVCFQLLVCPGSCIAGIISLPMLLSL